MVSWASLLKAIYNIMCPFLHQYLTTCFLESAEERKNFHGRICRTRGLVSGLFAFEVDMLAAKLPCPIFSFIIGVSSRDNPLYADTKQKVAV